MSQKVNIYSDEWCEMIFTDKNHEYGAFVLRKNSGKRHFRATLIAVIFFSVAVSSPVIIKSLIKEKHEASIDVNVLSNITTKPVDEKKEIPPEEPKQEYKSTMKFVPPVISETEVKEEIKTMEDVINNKTIISNVDVKGTNEETGVIPVVEVKDLTGEVEAPPLTVVEQMPEFPGGADELNKFIISNTHYPTVAREEGTTGTVYVTFVVNKSGKISQIKILRGIGNGCDEEAIRVVRMMPDWRPGKQNGATVSVQFNLPINFKLQ